MKKPLFSHNCLYIIFFFICCLFTGCSTTRYLQDSPAVQSPRLIGALLPLSGPHQSQGEAVKNGMLWACTQEIKPSCQIHFYDTELTTVQDSYQKALNDKVNFIVGPLIKKEVSAIINLPHATPVIALNKNDQNITPPPLFYELNLSPETEMHALVEKAIELKGQHALIISSQSENFQRFYRAFSEGWKKAGKSVTETFFYNSTTNFSETIPILLRSNASDKTQTRNDKQDNATPVQQQRRRRDFDVVILLSSAEEAQMIIPQLRYNYVIDTPLLASSSIYNGSVDTATNIDLGSVITCDIQWNSLNTLPIPKEKQTRLFALGRDAVMLSQQPSTLNDTQKHSNLWIGDLQLDDRHQLIRRPYCQHLKNELVR